jgi:hypothetical protein
MATQEIDSFILKFKYLMSAVRNLNLNIKVNAGKEIDKLDTDLGHPAGSHNHCVKN